MSSSMEAQHVSRIISTLHAVLDFSVERVADEIQAVSDEERDAVLVAVVRHVVQYQQLQESMREMERPGAWASTAEREQDEADLPYVLMTQSEFDAEKVRAKRDRRFPDWHGWRAWVERVDSKRRKIAVRSSIPAPRTPTLLECLYSERMEILHYGHAMFATEMGRRKALYDIEADIRRLGGRVEPTEEQREAMTTIEARLRQARAVKSCRRFIAGEVIRRFLQKACKKSSSSECEYCFDSFVSNNGSAYCSRTCEKFALRGKWD
jgi:hypothetical protein